ncbi:hypothetical protein ACFPT7_16725 [Acidicapsa dinghuensis]|uniref:Uncharacterized protein n=1 Tax=Acidicapsa dinghuensis TaxID=2218256 RepID=A0ABW1EI47_9BACT|nr:hypothetical protein [Acidicapsa dinghuensis]
MPMKHVGKFSVYADTTGYVARIQFKYIDDDGKKILTNSRGDFLSFQTQTVDPGDYGVPDQSILYLYLTVVAGKDMEAEKAFVYSKGNTSVAYYKCGGTTFINNLDFVKVEG